MPRNQRAAFKKLGIAAMLVAALLLGGNLTKATTAHAAPAHASIALTSACASAPSHAHCDGQDPIQMGCVSGAYAVRSAPLQGAVGTVYVEWSPTCQTNWARTVMQDNSCIPIIGDCWNQIYAQLYLLHFNSQGYYNGQATYLNLGTSGCTNYCSNQTIFWGNMYYAPTVEVMADGMAFTGNPGDEYRGCAYTGSSWKYSYPGSVPYCP